MRTKCWQDYVLCWDQVDLEARMVRLPAAQTKTRKPRTIPLAADVVEVLRMQRDLRDRYHPTCKHVFFRHASGEPLRDFRTAWHLACKRAGLWDPTAGKPDSDGKPAGKPTRLVHDLRRTAVRNLVRSGVADVTAMAVSGHKTRAVFDRYNITSESDLADAALRLDRHIRAKSSTSLVHEVQKPEASDTENARNLLN